VRGTSETVNADLRSSRGLTQFTVQRAAQCAVHGVVVRAGLQPDALWHSDTEMIGENHHRGSQEAAQGNQTASA
jgi:hypothetical protein